MAKSVENTSDPLPTPAPLVYLGTSGYNYPEWRGSFYPDDMPAKRMFAYYAERFRTVEINYTFYRMPTATTTEGWRAQAPDGFHYSLKAPRRITHDRRLKDTADLVEYFCTAARGLGPHLGPLLFQLPPTFKCDRARLIEFLTTIPRDIQAAFEFRHDSWLTDDIFAVLREHGAALCIADFGDKSTPVEATASHGYFRLRDEGYTPELLEKWADAVEANLTRWQRVFVYFKHEEAGKGPEFARSFAEILTRRGVRLA